MRDARNVMRETGHVVMGVSSIVLLIGTIDGLLSVNPPGSRVGKRFVDGLEVGGVLAKFPGMAAEFFVEKFQAAEDEGAVALAAPGDFVYG